MGSLKYKTMGEKRRLLHTCAELLLANEMTIAFAESATAGKVCSELALIPHAGKFLKGGIVCYDAKLKENILKVPSGLIKVFTPESMEVTRAITDGLSQIIEADFYVGVTGLTCAGGSETPDKPVGTMFVFGRHGQQQMFSERIVFSGSVDHIIDQTVKLIGEKLYAYLWSLQRQMA
jgi:nicotinamide-nucleotide amidase